MSEIHMFNFVNDSKGSLHLHEDMSVCHQRICYNQYYGYQVLHQSIRKLKQNFISLSTMSSIRTLYLHGCPYLVP